MASKNMKNLNQKTLTNFKDWIQYLPITWLKNLTPHKFSEQTGICLTEAEDFFEELLRYGLAEAKINMNCPFCKDSITVNYKSIKENFECSTCECSFEPRKYCINGDVLYKVDKGDFSDVSQTRRIPQINRLLNNHPPDIDHCISKDNVIFLDNKLEEYNNESYLDSKTSKQNNMRTKVFISYSHADKEFLERLKVHLRPLEREGKVVFWEDTKIESGQKWRDEIRKAIESAKVAVLLISPDFLASDFIADKELPPLLKAAEEEGTRILPVILSPCRFAHTESLSCFQAVNNPDETIIQMDKAGQEKLWVKVTEDITESLSNT